jgi:hypothetical protein
MVLDKAGGLVRVLHRWQLTGVNDHPEAVRAVASHLENLARDLGVLVDMKEQL